MSSRDPHADEEGPVPHFRRTDDIDVTYEPDENIFDVLPYMSNSELVQLGLRAIDEDYEYWGFPVTWYEHIPEGTMVYHPLKTPVEKKPFSRDTHIKEARYGVMPYGIKQEDNEERDN